MFACIKPNPNCYSYTSFCVYPLSGAFCAGRIGYYITDIDHNEQNYTREAKRSGRADNFKCSAYSCKFYMVLMVYWRTKQQNIAWNPHHLVSAKIFRSCYALARYRKMQYRITLISYMYLYEEIFSISIYYSTFCVYMEYICTFSNIYYKSNCERRII